MKELHYNIKRIFTIFKISFLFPICFYNSYSREITLFFCYSANFKNKPLFHTLRILFKETPFILYISTKNFANILHNAVRNCFIRVKRLLTIISTSGTSNLIFPFLFMKDARETNNILFNISRNEYISYI